MKRLNEKEGFQAEGKLLTGRPPEETLQWAATKFEGRVALASSLGPEDQVLTDMIVRSGLSIPIFTLDTGRLFPETLDLLQKTMEHYHIPISVYYPEGPALEKLVNRHGINLFRKNVELRQACCRVRKIEPLNRALQDLDAWICGLRREQGITRTKLEAVEWDESHLLFKINPLVDWRKDDLWRYIETHDVPHNPLHHRGFPSIGCACCTRAIEPGEDIRAGRWWWEAPERKECGLHLREEKCAQRKCR
jgi:phosphoadenosine phosphosulfate reductase